MPLTGAKIQKAEGRWIGGLLHRPSLPYLKTGNSRIFAKTTDLSMIDYNCDIHMLPIRDALDVIGNKWRLLILLSISKGNNRFKSILDSIPKLSAKVLTEELKCLETNLLIRREEDPHSFWLRYELTPHANSLEEVVEALQNWGVLHRQRLREA